MTLPEVPAKTVVTTTTSTVAPASAAVKSEEPSAVVRRPIVDFAFVREHLTMSQILEHLGLMSRLHVHGQQIRGPCPIHGQATDASRTFSVHLGKQVFRCFHAECGAKGNMLDLSAAIHKLPPYEAALHLAGIFGLPRNREEEPV